MHMPHRMRVLPRVRPDRDVDQECAQGYELAIVRTRCERNLMKMSTRA